MPTTPQNGGIDIGFEPLPIFGGFLANLLIKLISSSFWAVFLQHGQKKLKVLKTPNGVLK